MYGFKLLGFRGLIFLVVVFGEDDVGWGGRVVVGEEIWELFGDG